MRFFCVQRAIVVSSLISLSLAWLIPTPPHGHPKSTANFFEKSCISSVVSVLEVPAGTVLNANRKDTTEGTDPSSLNDDDDEKERKKKELMKSVGEQLRQSRAPKTDSSLLDSINPFRAGQNLRKTIDEALTSIAIPEETKSMYYVDDRFSSISEGALEDRLDGDDFVPEVLVVGATGEVGRLVVKRLLLEGKSRVRVLVRDLYTKTLDMFGTGVTYCQGDLSNVDSLEYAVTDVDKIIFCSSPPRPDEERFQDKFKEFMKEMLSSTTNPTGQGSLQSLELASSQISTASDAEWEELDAVLKARAELAEQVDLIGLRNLLQAYQNVRHADYGTSQAAKRSLFKFQGRPEDFNLFSLEETDNADYLGTAGQGTLDTYSESDEFEDYYGDDARSNEDYYDVGIEARRDAVVKTQTQWIRNQFGHGVFVGRVPKATTGRDGGEAAVMSTRLRSRQNPDNGIDLGVGFAGFIARVCSDGGMYEAFVRTKEYYENGIEYVCQFSTSTKPQAGTNKSRNKFVTVRLPFESFKPIQRQTTGALRSADSVPGFRGNDVRNIGFRYRGASNKLKSQFEPGEWTSFYLALSYIKLYRSQPEPEIVYLSDAEVPPVIRSGMVRHEIRQLVSSGSSDGSVTLLDQSTLQKIRSDTGHRSTPEETYYKYRGEELIRNSGLNYAIARVVGYNESPTAETTTIDIRSSNEALTPLSRAEIAQVCVGALMDPNALNKSFYVSKTRGSAPVKDDGAYLREKFSSLPADVVA